MKKFLFGVLLGVVAGVWGHWYLTAGRSENDLGALKDKVVTGAGKVKEAIQETVGDMKAEDIKEELSRTSMVVREKAKQAGAVIMDATANARTTLAIKTKLLAEPGVSALNINVDTTDGLVTLSGTVSAYEEVAKAVRIALETEGVHKVVSTLQVKPPK
jgi:hyperosmotically inducible protein